MKRMITRLFLLLILFMVFDNSVISLAKDNKENPTPGKEPVNSAGKNESPTQREIADTFLRFQQLIKQGDYQEAWNFIAQPLQVEMGGLEAFTNWASSKKQELSTLVIQVVKQKEKQAVCGLNTDSLDPELGFIYLEHQPKGWFISHFGVKLPSPYPLGQEEEFAKAAQEYSEWGSKCFSLQQRLYEIKRACNYLNQALPLEIKDGDKLINILQDDLMIYHDCLTRSILAAQLEAERFTEIVNRIRQNYNNLYTACAKAADTIHLAEPVPVEAPKLSVKESALGGAQLFGANHHNPNDPWDAFKQLRFDFLTVNFDPCSSRVRSIYRDSDFNFSSLAAEIAQNAAHGYLSILSQGSFTFQFCTFDPKEQELWRNYFTRMGRFFRDNSDLIGYELFNEPELAPYDPKSAWGEMERKAWQEYLANKYPSLAALNQLWKTKYKSFTEIIPPTQAPVGIMRPIQYEYGRFRQVALAQFLGMCCEALQAADPNHLVLSQMLEAGNYQDPYLVGQQPFDIYSLHMTFGGYHGPDLENNMVQAYGGARFLGKPLWQEEFIYNNHEAKNVQEGPILAAAMTRNLWQAIAWGFRGIEFFELDGAFGDWNNYILDLDANFGLLRFSGLAIGPALTRAKRLSRFLLSTEIVQPQIAILDSPAAKTYPVTNTTGILERWLSTKHCPYLIIPEAGLADRPTELANYRVLILPGTKQIGGACAQVIAGWIKAGGVLISIDDGGRYDEYGRLSALAPLLSHPAGKETGQGKIIKMPPISNADNPADLLPGFEKNLTLANIKNDYVTEDNPDLELIMRQGLDGTKYLVGINLSAKKTITFTIYLRGQVNEVIDLDCGNGFPIQGTKNFDKYNFRGRLEPGEATIWMIK
ncbi:MAG: beta-galactosidase [Firmicutes bacterium]|nr:beta-galactosidase [Bacillota bacterium]